MAKTTVYDIARELQISPSTVSRVLNNSSLISDEKKQLILETAERMNYERRVIRKQGCRAILNIRLFLPQSKFSYMNLFYDVAELSDGIRFGFGNTKINIILCTETDSTTIFDHKKTGETDGCVFAFCVPGPVLENRLNELSIPFVLLNREDPENNYILVDNQSGMNSLVVASHERWGSSSKFCYVGFSPLAGLSATREEAVSLSCKHLGIPFEQHDCFTLQTISEVQAVASSIVENGYNGILCFNDAIAVSVYNALLKMNISIPQQISLCGFDCSPILFLVDKRINTVEFSVQSLGREAGRWLKDWIIDKDMTPIQASLRGKYVKGDTI